MTVKIVTDSTSDLTPEIATGLGHSSIQMTIDTYSHVAPGIQEAAANRFDEILNVKHQKTQSIVANKL